MIDNKTIHMIETGRKKRRKRWLWVTVLLALLTIALCVAVVLLGNTIYPVETVWRVLCGEQIQGATFAIMTLRLPRMLAGLLAGFAFGIAGSTFQTILRNPLASPDIIGITSGASVAAVFCILVLRVSGGAASAAAVVAGLATTLFIYVLSQGGSFSGGRLILIGIGVQAMLNALVSYMLLKASNHDVPTAMRWLSGSLNAIQLKEIPPLALATVLCAPIILLLSNQLNILELGEQSATTLGVSTNITRLALMVSAVVLLAFATATTGPISFVAFLAGPIAKRLVGVGHSHTLPAGFMGAVLVLTADLLGQFAFSVKYPVGVITGILGAPYLIFLLIQMNRTGDI